MFSASGEPVSKPRAQFCVVLTSTGVVYPPEKTAWTWVYASRKSLSFNQRLRWVFKIQSDTGSENSGLTVFSGPTRETMLRRWDYYPSTPSTPSTPRVITEMAPKSESWVLTSLDNYYWCVGHRTQDLGALGEARYTRAGKQVSRDCQADWEDCPRPQETTSI